WQATRHPSGYRTTALPAHVAARRSERRRSPPGRGRSRDHASLLLQSLPHDAQSVRLQHPLDVLPAFLVIDPRPTSGRIQDDVDGAAGRERAAQVFVKAAMIMRDDQKAPQIAQ